MANTYYDATGVLVLEQVTPVISALFGRFKLDAAYPGNGYTYIAHIAEENDPQWNDVLCDLIALAAELDLPAPGCDEGEDSDQELTIETMLGLLAGHFGVSDNPDLLNLIEHHRFEDNADLDTLFLIATCFNDGHNLQEIRLEGCWHCSKPRLFEFGGEGRFLSREFEVSSTSGHAIELGSLLRPALVAGQIGVAADNLVTKIRGVLAGVTDDDQRRQLQSRVVELLGECSAAETATSGGNLSTRQPT